ncbi:MAG: adenylate/guanylate cyclase domain-containing protein [Eudoraea sp.]|uniref:adenylate/guanylate cyclase domain-containing protein n=1 Tax=Eudoraea sp. TaxID=1979955 RepID=UPI003C794986
MTMALMRKAYFAIGLFFLFSHFSAGQDQKLADSLLFLYKNGTYPGDELALLKRIADVETNPEKQLEISELLIKQASKDSLIDFLHNGYLQKGNAHQYLGNNVLALESYFLSLKYAHRIGDEASIGGLMISIAGSYTAMGNSQNAQNYYNKGIQILRKVNDSIKIGTALLNAGDDYFNSGKLDSALIYAKESEIIFKKINYPIGQAYSLGNLGMIYAEQEKDELAEVNINKAIAILEELEDYYPITVYLTYMSDIYIRKNDFPKAFNYAQRSLDLATQYGLKEQISEANLKLSELYEEAGNLPTSYKYYKDHIVYRDSVKNIETVQQMANQRTDYEVSQKQIEIDLAEQREKNQRNMTIGTAIALLLIGIMAIGLYRRNNFIRKTKQIIEEEKERSDKLLLNILPEETALELKEKGKVKAKKHEAVSVLFSDFKGFTRYSEKLSPEALVETIDFYFSKFDAIIEKHGLEKIKTIGDAYMCAGGLHDNEKDHASRMVLAALEITAFVEETKNDVAASELTFDIRIGINTGPVVAGVVGTNKFAYDIWGDTVNVAARMESMSEPGRINISENTYALIKDDADCTYRGEIEAKNRGKLKMYFVNEVKTAGIMNG